MNGTPLRTAPAARDAPAGLPRLRTAHGRALAALAALALACIAGAAFGQDGSRMDLSARLHQSKLEGRELGCGIRIVGTVPGKSDSDIVPVVDFVLNLDEANGVALVRGVYLEGTRGAINSGKRPDRQPIESIWLRVLGGASTAPITREFLIGSDVSVVVYATTPASAAAVLEAAAQKRPVQIGVRPKGADADRVFNGTIEVVPADQPKVAACAQAAKAMPAAAPPKQ